MIEAFRKLFFAEFLDEGRIGEIGLSKKRFGGAKVFLLFPVNGNLRFGEFVRAPGCLRFCFLANFGHGSNSLWRIDFDCDATTRNSPGSGKLTSRKRRTLPEPMMLLRSHASQSMKVATSSRQPRPKSCGRAFPLAAGRRRQRSSRRQSSGNRDPQECCLSPHSSTIR